jgi:AcrR family transcriptional regulator
VEKVAASAELGRATVYGYFVSLEELIATMAEEVQLDVAEQLTRAAGLAEALDVPVRLSQKRPAAFALLFPPSIDLRPAFDSERVRVARQRARQAMVRLTRIASRSGASLPGDLTEAAAIVSGVSLAGAVIPELQSSTPLRRRWQEFCLGLLADAGRDEPGPEDDDTGR